MRRNVKEIGKSLSAAAAFTTASSRRSHPPLPQLPSAATAASSRHWHHSAAQQPPQLSARQPCSALPFAAQQRTSCSAAVCRVKHVFFFINMGAVTLCSYGCGSHCSFFFISTQCQSAQKCSGHRRSSVIRVLLHNVFHSQSWIVHTQPEHQLPRHPCQ